MSDPEKLGDVLRREQPELFGGEVQMPDGVDENTRIEVPACFGISGTILERGKHGNITSLHLDSVSLLKPPSRRVHYVDIASLHRRAMLSGRMYGGASAGKWSEFDGE